MVKVSVVIPVYNVEKYLDQGIESVLRQTLEDIEIILVNDGSTEAASSPAFLALDTPPFSLSITFMRLSFDACSLQIARLPSVEPSLTRIISMS